MSTDWNDDPPAPVSEPEDPSRSELQAADLPELQDFLSSGWELAPEAPIWAFLPAIWPMDHRAWIRDRARHVSIEFSSTGQRFVEWSIEDFDEIDRDYANICALAGVPARPSGRLWLLRSPDGRTVNEILEEVLRLGEAEGVSFQASRQLTELTRRVIAEGAE